MTTTTKKRGKISRSEQEYVAANHETMTVAEIAMKLRRTEDAVRRQIAALPTVERTIEQSDWVARLHASIFWVEIKKGLMGSEVGFFEQSWASYSNQLVSSSDIVATDELMMKDLIMLDIFSQRAIAAQTNAMRLMDELEKVIVTEEDKAFEDRDALSLNAWKTQVNSLSAAKLTMAKQHLDYQARKDAKLRDLKGSRDQRFKQIEESRHNFFELVKELDIHRSRVKEGHQAEKMKMAAQITRDDWNEVMEFEDGIMDKPFLSPEGELQDDRLQNEQK